VVVEDLIILPLVATGATGAHHGSTSTHAEIERPTAIPSAVERRRHGQELLFVPGTEEVREPVAELVAAVRWRVVVRVDIFLDLPGHCGHRCALQDEALVDVHGEVGVVRGLHQHRGVILQTLQLVRVACRWGYVFHDGRGHEGGDGGAEGGNEFLVDSGGSAVQFQLSSGFGAGSRRDLIDALLALEDLTYVNVFESVTY